MRFTFYGHACFRIETGGKHLLFDPFITPNGRASEIDVDSIPADYVVLTHGHEDHVADVERIVKRTDALIVGNYEIVSWYAAKGITNGHPMNHGGSKTFDFGTLKMVNAVHSSVLPDGTYGGNPGGYVLRTNDKNVYIAGDTALTLDMKLIGEYESIDFAVVPIGDNFTMGPEDAAICCEFAGTNHAIGVHFDTFPYIEIDAKKAKETFRARGISMHVPAIGETIEI
ncbi:MAG: metal-dependent hydrolase [Flavobacteriales bacterium]|nr:metal-dependent hydrolase [Flavobacteriales bacterium]